MKSCILTVIKNEHEYLDEWIKYHLDLGIDHIFIFEDIDSDSHKEICYKYGDKVSLDSILSVLNDYNKELIFELKKTKEWNAQHIYFRFALLSIKSSYRGKYDWCFVIDNDEFITLANEKSNLIDTLTLYSEYDAFVMKWKCYGANGLIKKPNYKEKGVIGTYTKEAEGIIPDTPDSFIKTCYNLNTYTDAFFYNQHHPSDICKWCDTNFIKNRYIHSYNNIYIRHYITKSWEEYVWKRKTRGFVWGGARNFDFFFSINRDMVGKKEELVGEIRKEKLVVLPYKQNSSQGNEIKIALNGWKKHCKFDYHFVVIGEFDKTLVDEFPWVEFITCEQLEKKNNQYNPHLNVHNCFRKIDKRFSNIYDGFITMADDEYAIKDFYLDDIMTIHHHSSSFTGCKECPTSFWRYDLWKTRKLLDKENLPHVNYTTHYPCYFEFNKFRIISDKFNMSNESYVLENIYFNYFSHKEPILDDTIRLGIWDKKIFENDFQKAIDNPSIKFMCNSVEGWSKELENKLSKLLML